MTAFITDEIVALKRLKMEKEKEGFPITSLREINTLLKAQHINIVTVRVGSLLCNSYSMACPPVRGDNPRALASGLSYVQVDKHGITILYHRHQCRPCTSLAISC